MLEGLNKEEEASNNHAVESLVDSEFQPKSMAPRYSKLPNLAAIKQEDVWKQPKFGWH
jgi:hypothetical protein